MRRCLPAIGLLLGVAGACERSAGDRPAAADHADQPARRDASPRRAAVWPAFPRGGGAARAVIVRERRRRCDSEDEPALDSVVRRALAEQPPSWIAGERAIHAWIAERLARGAQDAFLLWGTFHDAPAQLAAFRRVVGPGGVAAITHVVAEQLDAGSAWEGIHPALQRGDDAPLRDFLQRGDRRAFGALMLRQRRLDYTAWKYGYLSEIADLIIAARASRVPLLGCDMPRPLQRIGPRDLDLRDRLREVHCLRHLHDRRGAGPARVAMLWGQSHVAVGAVPRFLPRDTAVLAVRVFGGRLSAQSPERALGRRVALFDPLLIPLLPACPEAERVARALLLLPGAELAGTVDRARDPLPAAERPPRGCAVEAHAEVPGTLQLGGRRVQIGRKPIAVEVAAGELPFALHAAGAVLAGALELPERGRVALSFDPRARAVRIIVRR